MRHWWHQLGDSDHRSRKQNCRLGHHWWTWVGKEDGREGPNCWWWQACFGRHGKWGGLSWCKEGEEEKLQDYFKSRQCPTNLGVSLQLTARPSGPVRIVRSWSMITIGGSLVPQVCAKQNCPGLPPSEMTPADQDLEPGTRTHSGRGTGWWKPQGGNYGHTPSSEMLWLNGQILKGYAVLNEDAYPHGRAFWN